MNYSNMTIGERIKALRTIKDQTRKESEPKMTQARLADLVETSQVQIARYENDQSQIPACDLPKFARALNSSVSFIVEAADPENVTVAEDLGLSNESIEILKRTKDWYKYNGIPEEMLINYKPKNRAPLHDLVNLILKNEELSLMLWRYLFTDLDNMYIKLPERYDLVFRDGARMPNMEVIPVSEMQNFRKDGQQEPWLKDFEPIVRLQIMDELKSLRNSLTEERKVKENGND